MRFSELNLPAPLSLALAERGYADATPVQAAVLQADAGARDLLVSAQTGSGKTVAFGLALAPQLLGDAHRFGPAAMPLALVVAPTRELAQQVSRELSWLYGEAGGKVATCVGGTDARAEAKVLAGHPHVVVGTPGRLCDHLARRQLRLDSLHALVLDEADEMLDMGFRDELEKLLHDAPPGRRTLLFSATVPRGIEELARRYQRDALRIAAGPVGQGHADIEYRAHLIAQREREHAVVNLLRAGDDEVQALVFCETRHAVAHLHANLLERGFGAVAISGELSQSERTRALQALRDKRARVLVATDVAARGLDLPAVGLVIHADLPHDPEVLLHRSGRTGRAGRKGVAALLVPFSRSGFAERMFARAKVKAAWSPVPTADQVHARDAERLVRELTEPGDPPSADDLALAEKVLSATSAQRVAAALVRLRRSLWPSPEELPETAAMSARAAKAPARASKAPVAPGKWPARTAPPAQTRSTGPRASAPPARAPYAKREAEGPARHPANSTGRARAPDFRAGPRPVERRPGRDATARTVPARFDRAGASGSRDAVPRAGKPAGRAQAAPPGDSVWFRINVGRQRNADPKWLVPLICRRGGLTKGDIGKIQIAQDETRVAISGQAARRFAAAVKRPDPKDPNIRIEPI